MKRRNCDTRKLAQLIRRRGPFCEFCREKVRQVSSIPMPRRVSQSAHHVTFHVGRRTVTEKIATLEHEQPLCEGGTYDNDNLRVACSQCNNARAKATHRRRAKERKPGEPGECRHCGETFSPTHPRYRHSRSCRACHKRNSEPYRPSTGLGDMILEALEAGKDGELRHADLQNV